MTAEERAYIAMARATKATSDAHNAAWAAFPEFAGPYARLAPLLDRATTAIGLQGTSTKPTTANKNLLRTGLSARLARLSNTVVLWARTAGANPTLAGQAQMTESSFSRGAEDKMLGRADRLLSYTPGANTTPPTLPSSLTRLGVDAAFITALKADLDLFAEAIGKPRHVRSEAVRGGEELDAVIDELHDLFEDLDAAAAVLQYTQPAFYSEYRTSRKIIDPGYRTRVLTVRISNAADGRPLSGVRAAFLPETPELPEKTTGPEGEFYIETAPAGDYQMTLALAGFREKTVPVALVEGEHVEVEETMVRG